MPRRLLTLFLTSTLIVSGTAVSAEALQGVVKRGDARDNFLAGTRGDDKLYGNAGADRLIGAAGNDRLEGGPGFDRMSGGAGNDYIVAKDGERDIVDCGPGKRDTVVYDVKFDTIRNCEFKRR